MYIICFLIVIWKRIRLRRIHRCWRAFAYAHFIQTLLLILTLTNFSGFSQTIKTRKNYYKNGQIQYIYTCNNGIPDGSYKSFYNDGKKWAVGNYNYGKLDGNYTVFTNKGDTAYTMIFDIGKVWTKKIFYQEYPDFTYQPISKKGFITVADGTPVVLDTNTPDGFLEQTYDEVMLHEDFFIWQNGQRKAYEFPKADGTIETIYSGPMPGIYEWKNKNKSFVRPFTKEEQDGKNNDAILKLLKKFNTNKTE